MPAQNQNKTANKPTVGAGEAQEQATQQETVTQETITQPNQELKRDTIPAPATPVKKGPPVMRFEILRGIHQGRDGITYGPTGSGYPHVVEDTADLEKTQGSDKFKRLGGHVTASPAQPTLAELRAAEEARQAAAVAAGQPTVEHGDE